MYSKLGKSASPKARNLVWRDVGPSSWDITCLEPLLNCQCSFFQVLGSCGYILLFLTFSRSVAYLIACAVDFIIMWVQSVIPSFCKSCCWQCIASYPTIKFLKAFRGRMLTNPSSFVYLWMQAYTLDIYVTHPLKILAMCLSTTCNLKVQIATTISDLYCLWILV